LSQSKELKGKVTAVSTQSSSETSDGKILARSSANEDVRAGGEVFEFDFREVAIVLYSWVVMSEDRAGEFVDFGETNSLPAEGLPRYGRSFYSRTHGQIG
jgi:hypothetical protein